MSTKVFKFVSFMYYSVMSYPDPAIPDYMYRREARRLGRSSWDEVPDYLKRRFVRTQQDIREGVPQRAPRETVGRESSINKTPGTLSSQPSRAPVSPVSTVRRRSEAEVRSETPRYGLPDQKTYIPPSSSTPYGIDRTRQDNRLQPSQPTNITPSSTAQEFTIGFNQNTSTRISPGYKELLEKTRKERLSLQYEEARQTGARITPGLTSAPEYAERPAYKDYGLPDYITQDLDKIRPAWLKIKEFEQKYITPPLKETVIPAAQKAISYGTGLELISQARKAIIPETKKPEFIKQGEQVMTGISEGLKDYASKPITRVAPDYLIGGVTGKITRGAVRIGTKIPGIKQASRALTRTLTRRAITSAGVSGVFAGTAIMSQAPKIMMQPTLKEAGKAAGESTGQLVTETVGFMGGYTSRLLPRPSPTRTGQRIGLRYGAEKQVEIKKPKQAVVSIERKIEVPEGKVGVPQETIVRAGSGKKLLRYKTTKIVDPAKGQYAYGINDWAVIDRPTLGIRKIKKTRTTRRIVFGRKPVLSVQKTGYGVFTQKIRKPGRIKTRTTYRTPFVEVMPAGKGLPRPSWSIIPTTKKPIPISERIIKPRPRQVGYTPKIRKATLERVSYTTRPLSYTPPKPAELEGVVIIQRRPSKRFRTIPREKGRQYVTSDGQVLIQETKMQKPKTKRVIDLDELLAKERAAFRDRRAKVKQKTKISRQPVREVSPRERLRLVSIGATKQEAKLRSALSASLRLKQDQDLKLIAKPDLKQDQDLKLIAKPDLKQDQDLKLITTPDLRTPRTPELTLRLETPPPIPPPPKLRLPQFPGGRKKTKKKPKRKTSAIYSPSFSGVWGFLSPRKKGSLKTITKGAGLYARPTILKTTKKRKKKT